MSKRRRPRQPARVGKPMRAGPPVAADTPLSGQTLRIIVIGIVLVAAAVVVGVGLFGSGGQTSYACDSQLAGTADADGQVTRDLGNRHVGAGANLRYAYCPPASGDHFSASGLGPIPPRFYGPESALSPGGWIHNLEHGYVAVLYSCGVGGADCPTEDELASLKKFQGSAPATASAGACGVPSKVLTGRFDGMGARFALLSWNRVALSDAFDPAAARAFASRWIDQAPEPRAC